MDVNVNSDDNLSKTFNIAASYVASISLDVSVDDRLYLYSHYKQAIEGECSIPKPSFFDLQGRKKWEAWKSLKQLPKEKAMELYIEKVTELDPSWELVAPTKTGWVSVSTMVREDPIDESAKNIFDFVQENNLDKMKLYSSEELSVRDESGMSLLHWASDRGYLEMVQYLLKQIPQHINSQDNEGQTPLHYAVSCSHEEVVKILLANNANTSIKDEEGTLPIDLSQSESITSMLK
ncbi:Acyl-CoA-binding domain-containing protein 6 [Armadillidium vulgare]|nr:Acyl-CoA-binding domain-containing protein 6 [Armadillidium vulgare]RXG74067.1 Acyl-CoA-binding domain-containing protein 6 [Armadillidium vulgare]